MKSQFLKLSYFILLLIISSVVYLNTFWNVLGIDIFPYLNVDNLILYALKPLMNKALPVVIGLLVGIIYFEKVFPYGGYKDLQLAEKKTGKKLITKTDKILRFLILIFVLIIPFLMIIYIYFKNRELYYIFLPYIISPLSFLLTNRLIEYGAINNVQIDSKIVFISVFFLISSFSTAKVNSNKIRNNHEFQYISKNKKILKLMGKAGDYYLFSSIENSSMSILKYEEIKDYIFFEFNGFLKNHNDSLIIKETHKNSFNKK